jgi:hypothetical protein
MPQSAKAHAYGEGLRDGENGKTREANPYFRHPAEYYLWEVGCLAGTARNNTVPSETIRGVGAVVYRPLFDFPEGRRNVGGGARTKS